MNYFRQVIVLLGVFLYASHAFGALTVTVTGANQVQAVIKEQGFSGACTIQLSTSPSMTPLHADVNGTAYSGANTDTGRTDTITSTDGTTRIVTLGHMTDDRALAAFTTYYYRVSGCGETVDGNFTTANLAIGTTRTEQSPFNSSKWGNLGLPAFDWTKKQEYVDPMTGVTLMPMALTTQTWRTGGGGNGAQPGFSRAFTDWSGGSGWTNPSGVLSGASTSASTGNTNPIDLYANLDNTTAGGIDPVPYDYHRILEDVGIVVWGKGSSSTAADRIVNLCIVLNPAAGCASNTLQVTLPTGSVAQVSSRSSDPDGAWPAAFPASPFHGWTAGNSPVIRMENLQTFGTVAVAGHNLTIASPTPSTHFSSVLAAGYKIFITGSSCANNLCTLSAAPASANLATVTETPGDGTFAFRAYGWGIRVWKDNANGTVTVGAKFKLAGSNTPIGVQPGGDKCSSVAVTSGDGKKGHLCSITSAVNGFGWLAFIATDGTTRLLSYRTNFSFDETQGNVFYQSARNSAGGWTVLKSTYTGDYTAELNYNYGCSSDGGCQTLNEPITTVDLMPHSANADLDQQIRAAQGTTLPAYDSSLYGAWTQSNPAVNYYGSSGHFAHYCNVYAGQGQPQGGGPGWCAYIDLSQSPAKVVRLVHTLDGTGNPIARFGSLHSAQQIDSRPNTMFLSLDMLQTGNKSILNGGPFQAQVVSILGADGSTWNSNTALRWPPDNNYFRTCPAGSDPYKECVTFRLPKGGVCNVAATANMVSKYPCPWNPSYSQYPLMQAGDNAVDLAGNPGNFDTEHFHILSVSPDADNTLRVVAARNGTYDYCSISPWHGQVNKMSAQAPSQLQHANGWNLTMMPGSVNTCGWAALLQDQITGDVQELGRSFSGHFEIGKGSNGLNYVTSSATIYNVPFEKLGHIPPVFSSTGVQFAGIPSYIGAPNGLQSYADDSQFSAGANGYNWAIDMNPFVNCMPEMLGCGPLRAMNSVGGNVYLVGSSGSATASRTTYKIQPMIGWAGRYQLQDVSGPGSSVDATPYSMCFALLPGECHAGSAANSIYVNVPSAFNPTYCTGSLSWANIPCVFFGNNAPGGGVRQFGIYTNDPTGAKSRFISNGWASMGRHYPYSHATAYQTGKWAMLMGTNLVDGLKLTGFMISLPPWAEGEPDNDFKKNVTIQAPAGPRYAEVQFGYSRYVGPGRAPANGLFCTSRSETCNTSAASLFNFESENRILKNCATGCTISVPAVGPNVLYYRVRRSADGKTWTASDIQAIALQ